MPKLTRQQFLGWKTEATAGTAETLTDSDFYHASDVNLTFESDEVRRPVNLGSFSDAPGWSGGILARLNFGVEVVGSGTAGTAPFFGDLLEGCGFTETLVGATSATYAESAAFSDQKHVSFQVYQDGLLHKVNGAVGTFKVPFEMGNPGRFEFEFLGRYNGDPSDGTNPTPTYATTKPEPTIGTTLTLDSFSPISSKLEFDIGNTLSARGSLSDTFGNAIPAITARESVGMVDAEVDTVANYAFLKKWRENTKIDGSFVLGATAGNILTVAWDMILTGAPAAGDTDGVLRYDAPFRLISNDLAGENAITFVWT